MSNRLIKKVSKIARNSLQEDLIRTLDFNIVLTSMI